MFTGEGDQLVPLGGGHVAAGRVAGEVIQDGHCVLIDPRFEVFYGRDEAVLEGAGVKIRLAAAYYDVRRV